MIEKWNEKITTLKLIPTSIDSSLQLSSSDLSLQLAVWSHLGRSELEFVEAEEIPPLLHVDTLPVVAGEETLGAGRQLDQLHLRKKLQGVFFNWYPPKKLKYGKHRLGESTLT